MDSKQLKSIIEAALFAAAEPLSIGRLQDLFDATLEVKPTTAELREVLNELSRDYADRGIELKELASGFCFQVKLEVNTWVKRLWQERAPKYSRAFLETLAAIAYRQPITRGEIEDLRGVSVNSAIIKTLLEREWIRVVGQREVPGRPSLYATTKQFLDHFNLLSLEQLPPLEVIPNLEEAASHLLNEELASNEAESTPPFQRAAVSVLEVVEERE